MSIKEPMAHSQKLIGVTCLLSPKIHALLHLLSVQENLTPNEMASVLLTEAVRRSLDGDIHFPVFDLSKLFPPQEATEETDPGKDWKGRCVWCNNCADKLVNLRCDRCEWTDEKRPTNFRPAFER